MVPRFILLLACLVIVAFSAGFSQEVAANATRPSASDNAYLTARGYAEIEVGWLKNKNLWSVPALLKIGFHKNLEFAFAMSGIVDRPDGGTTDVGTPGAQVKVQIVDEPWGAIATAGRLDWPAHASPSYTVYPVASLHTQPVQVDLTAGGSFANAGGSGYSGSFFYAAAVSPKLEGKVGVFGEVFGSISTGVSAHSVDFGVSYAATPRFVLDASIAFGLTDDADSWTVQVGLTSTLFKLLP